MALVANPWRQDRPSDRFPAIVQDFIVIVLFTVIGTVLLHEQLLTTSAVGAVVVGFALQDTLGNLFAGLAIQIERPFRVGHWIRVVDQEGQVQEITWRATKLRTKEDEFLVVPNSVISREMVLNYSEPTIPTQLVVEVGSSYLTPPNEVRQAIYDAIAAAPLALKEPAPKVLIKGFGGSSVDFAAYFWIDNYALDREARDQVRTNIWYLFRRRNLEIPWPIQIEYSRTDEPTRTDAHVAAAADQLATVDLFKTLTPDALLALSKAADEHIYADGESIVRQDAEGDSMFVILSGQVRVVLEPAGQEVAVIPVGGFFGEMSMLTGNRRTATVKAIGDVRVLEIEAGDFRELALANPGLLDHVSSIMATRRTGLDDAKSAAAGANVPAAKETFLARMRRFLSLN